MVGNHYNMRNVLKGHKLGRLRITDLAKGYDTHFIFT